MAASGLAAVAVEAVVAAAGNDDGDEEAAIAVVVVEARNGGDEEEGEEERGGDEVGERRRLESRRGEGECRRSRESRRRDGDRRRSREPWCARGEEDDDDDDDEQWWRGGERPNLSCSRSRHVCELVPEETVAKGESGDRRGPGVGTGGAGGAGVAKYVKVGSADAVRCVGLWLAPGDDVSATLAAAGAVANADEPGGDTRLGTENRIPRERAVVAATRADNRSGRGVNSGARIDESATGACGGDGGGGGGRSCGGGGGGGCGCGCGGVGGGEY